MYPLSFDKLFLREPLDRTPFFYKTDYILRLGTRSEYFRDAGVL